MSVTGDGDPTALELIQAYESSAEAVEQLRAQGPLDAAQLQQLFDDAQQEASSNPHLANRAMDVCLELADEVGAAELVPAAQYLQARLSLTQGRTKEALTSIEASKAGWLRLGRPLDAYRTELGRMHVLDELGQHGLAADAATSLLDDLDQHPADELSQDDAGLLSWIKAAALENLGVSLGLTGKHQEALDAYRSAEAAYEQVGEIPDSARAQGNQGVELIALGQPEEALGVLNLAADLFHEADDQLSHAMCLSNMSEAELLLGHYAQALTHYESARPIFEAQGARPELYRLDRRAVRAYLALNLIDEAETLAVEVSAALADLDLSHDRSDAQWLLAMVMIQARRPAEALQHLAAATEGARSVDDPPLIARSLLTTSDALKSLGDIDGAIASAKQALDVLSNGHWEVDELAARLCLAQLPIDSARDNDSRNSSEAEEHLREAEVLSERLQLAHLRYPVLWQVGLQHRRQGRTNEARQSFGQAIELTEQLRSLVPDELSRLSFLHGRTTAHTDLISMLVETTDPDDHLQAYHLAEASKARVLVDALSAVGGVAPSPVTPASTTPLATEQVIEYHVVGDELVAFAWVLGELHVVAPVAAMSDVNERLFQWDLQRRRLQADNGVTRRHHATLVETARRSLFNLWLTVFFPVVDHLDPAMSDLTIVPHGPLNWIPFHALMSPTGPVGQQWNITVSPSVAVTQRLRSRPERGLDGSSLVIGVPDASAPAVLVESSEVAEALPDAELLTGPEATSEALSALAADRDVIHLACHGIHSESNPMYSGLRLADGWLTASDVLSLDLDRSLVVLSACDSGRQGGRGNLDEAIGFARSFLAVGASAVVVSLWLAADEATRSLMGLFYEKLLSGSAPSNALRQAEASLIADYPHPADWAPFIIHGHSR